MLNRLRIAHKTEVVELLHVWFNDSNAIVRQKVDEAAMEQRASLVLETDIVIARHYQI